MVENTTLRAQLLAAAVPYILAVHHCPGITRIALFGSLTTQKSNPKDIDLLINVENTTDLMPIAAAGRKLQGRITTFTHGSFGADLFLATSHNQYLGRFCMHRECPASRRCEAEHCGYRPYLCDDLHTVTLTHSLLSAPPIELWPTIIARVSIPNDVEESLLTPLTEQLKLQRLEEIVPHTVCARLYRRGRIDQAEWAALQTAAAFLAVPLREDAFCSLTEIHQVDIYAPLLHVQDDSLHLEKLWAIELGNSSCLVLQGIQKEEVVYFAR